MKEEKHYFKEPDVISRLEFLKPKLLFKWRFVVITMKIIQQSHLQHLSYFTISKFEFL